MIKLDKQYLVDVCMKMMVFKHNIVVKLMFILRNASYFTNQIESCLICHKNHYNYWLKLMLLVSYSRTTQARNAIMLCCLVIISTDYVYYVHVRYIGSCNCTGIT